MDIIPVIDLLKGQAVHARAGQRHLYLPVETFGGGKGVPDALIAAYLELAKFRTFYLADLDALTGHPPQWDLIHQLVSSFSDLSFWVDSGPGDLPEALSGKITRVFGSESLPPSIRPMLDKNGILSLDFLGSKPLGPLSLMDQIKDWPDRVIVMNLDRVGTDLGPDLGLLGAILEAHPDRQIYAAGGIRSPSDLWKISKMGVQGVLMATALQRGHIGRSVLNAVLGS